MLTRHTETRYMPWETYLYSNRARHDSGLTYRVPHRYALLRKRSEYTRADYRLGVVSCAASMARGDGQWQTR
jgi:hypothetical protein